jgi:hypothetical protein
VDISTVSSRLGHANSSTTLNIYAHVLDANDRNAADMIGELLGLCRAVAAGPCTIGCASHTAVAVDNTEHVLDEFRVRACTAQTERLRSWAKP